MRFSNHAKSVVGAMMKIPMNSASARTIDRATCRGVSRSSSSRDWLAETINARMPIASDCPSTMIPRKNGFPRSG